MIVQLKRGIGINTREKLVNAAFELFHQQGYGSTGIAQILKRADVKSGSLYYFFPTKEELLIAVLEWCKENLWPELIEPVFEKIDDPIERIFGVLNGYRQMLTMTGFKQGCPIGNLALELADHHPAIRKLLADNFDGWCRAIEICLNDSAGRFPDAIDRRQLSQFVLTTMEGAVMLARTYQSLDPFDSAVSQLRDYIERIMQDGSDWNRPNTRPNLKEN